MATWGRPWGWFADSMRFAGTLLHGVSSIEIPLPAAQEENSHHRLEEGEWSDSAKPGLGLIAESLARNLAMMEPEGEIGSSVPEEALANVRNCQRFYRDMGPTNPRTCTLRSSRSSNWAASAVASHPARPGCWRSCRREHGEDESEATARARSMQRRCRPAPALVALAPGAEPLLRQAAQRDGTDRGFSRRLAISKTSTPICSRSKRDERIFDVGVYRRK